MVVPYLGFELMELMELMETLRRTWCRPGADLTCVMDPLETFPPL